MTSAVGPDLSGSRPARRPARLGVAAFALAMALFVLLPLLGYVTVFMPPDQGSAFYRALGLAQAAGMIVALLLGLAAVITDRGRPWGFGAMAVSIFGTQYLWTTIVEATSR